MASHVRIAVCVSLLVVPATVSAAEDPAPMTYVLAEGSSYQHGCFDPCDCLIEDPRPLRGTFDLIFTGNDWLFDYFAVTDVHWRALGDAAALPIDGSGSYRIGGEFARMHQLSLDLEVGDLPVEHFDSGLIVGGSEFPAIDLTVSIHGQVCLDTVLHVVAKPTSKLAVDRAALRWEALPLPALYDVVWGDLQSLRASGGDFAVSTRGCLAADWPSPDLALPPDAATDSGSGVFFLVGAHGAGASATYDVGSASQLAPRDAGILASPAHCP